MAAIINLPPALVTASTRSRYDDPHRGVALRSENALSPVDIVWHVLNLLAPALGVAALAALLARLLMRRSFATIGWARLLGWPAAAALVATMAGLAVYGRDGRIETYVALVLAVALGLAAAAWRGRTA